MSYIKTILILKFYAVLGFFSQKYSTEHTRLLWWLQVGWCWKRLRQYVVLFFFYDQILLVMPICNNYKNEIPIFLFFKNMYQNVTIIQILLFQNAVRVIPGKDVPLNVFTHYLETIARKFVSAYKWSSVILGMDAS